MKRLPCIFLIMVLLTGFLWALPLGGQAAFAKEVAQVAQSTDTTGEDNQSGASKKAKEKLDMASDTWNRVTDWFMGYINAFKGEVDKVFGFDKGEASGAFFGTVLYAGVGLVFLFVAMFVYNIIRDMFSGVAAKKKYKKRR